MTYDDKRIEVAVLALLATFRFDEDRSWKGYDFDVMNTLHQQGFIHPPQGKAKSVALTAERLRKGEEIADRLFAAGDKTA